MAHRLKTQTGKTLYKIAQANGRASLWIIKEVMGFRHSCSGASQGRAGMDAGLCELQPQAMFTLKNLVTTS